MKALHLFPMMNSRRIFLSLCILIGIFGISLKALGDEKHQGGFAVHVASFRDRERAEGQVEFLHSKGLSASQERVDLGDRGMWYRVYAGYADSKEEAKAGLAEIKKLHLVDSAKIVWLEKAESKPAAGVDDKKATPRTDDLKNKTVKKVLITGIKDVSGSATSEGLRREPAPLPGTVMAIASLSAERGPPAGSQGRSDDSAKTEGIPSPVQDLKAGQGKDCKTVLFGLKKEADDALLGSAARDRLFLNYADCAFSLGLEGDPGLLLSAIDYYRHVLRMKGKGDEEEDRIRYRIALSYETLGYFYEARGAYENLLTVCPESPYAPESLFRTARMMFRTEKYQEAIDAFVAYLKKHPDDPRAKEAYFAAGMACSRLGKPFHAEVWFRDGMKKWPDYQDIPEDFLFGLGTHFLSMNKYNDALSVLTEYVSLYPGRPETGKALYGAAMSLYESARPDRAMFLFSEVLENFPESREAGESLLMLARIALENPGLRLPRAVKGWEVLLDPVQACDQVIDQYGYDTISKKAFLYKAMYLNRKERWDEAVETCLALQEIWGWGKEDKEAALSLLKSGTDQLVRRYAAEGDDLAVGALYFRTYGRGWIRPDDFRTHYLMGKSLERIGDFEEAVKVYDQATAFATTDRDRFLALSSQSDSECRTKRRDRALKRLNQVLTEPKTKENLHLSSMIREKIAGVYFDKGEREKAVALYDALFQTPWTPEDPVTVYGNIGRFFQEKAQWGKAIGNYDKVLAHCAGTAACGGEVILRTGRDRARCSFMAEKYQDGLLFYEGSVEKETRRNMKLWTLFKVGQGYALSGETGKSQKTLSDLKEAGEDVFWVNLADWWLYDHQWMNAHDRFLDNPDSS